MIVIVYTLMFLLLSSGGLFFAIVLKHRFEEGIVFGVSGTILLLYIFGLCGKLAIGFWSAILVLLTLFAFSLGYAYTKGPFLNRIKSVVASNGFSLFLFGFLFVIYICGAVCVRWADEVSYWSPAVMVMSLADDFATNSDASLSYASFIPGMSLFQYFVEKIFFLVNGKDVFWESGLYVAYNMLIMTYIPLIACRFNCKKSSSLIIMVVFLMLPILFFNGRVYNAYQLLQVDVPVAMLSGYGVIYALQIATLEERNDSMDFFIMLSFLIILPLIKTSGLLYAITVFLILLVSQKQSGNFEIGNKKNIVRFLACGGVF